MNERYCFWISCVSVITVSNCLTYRSGLGTIFGNFSEGITEPKSFWDQFGTFWCVILQCVNGLGRSGGQTAGGHPKAFPRPRQPLSAVPALRELESACRVSIL